MFTALPRPFGRPFRLGLVSDPSPLGTGTRSPVWVGCVGVLLCVCVCVWGVCVCVVVGVVEKDGEGRD